MESQLGSVVLSVEKMVDSVKNFEELKIQWWDKKADFTKFSIGVEKEAHEFNPSQETFFNDRESRAVLLSGGYRSGKTDVLLRKCVLLSLLFPGNEGLLGRKTATEVEVITLPQLEEICDPRLYEYHAKQMIIEFVNGSKIYLRGLDVLQGEGNNERKKAIAFIRGLNLGWYAIDQAESVDGSIIEHLTARLSRNTVPFRQAMLTSNPTNFWGYDCFKKNLKKGYRLLEVSMFENERNLPPDYLEEQLEYKETRPRYFQQYVLGKWDEFMMSEDTVVEKKVLEKVSQYARDPLTEWKGFKIYKQPNDRHFYRVGVDPTEGQHDNGVVQVVDTQTGEQVAVYAQRVLYDILAERVNDICGYYRNIELVIPESNNYALVMQLQNYNWRIFRDKNYGSDNPQESDKLGFRTTREKKRYLAQNFEELASTGKLTVYDRETISELNTFVHLGDRIGGASGKYDDRVMSLFLACLDINPEVSHKVETVHSINKIKFNEFLNNREPQRLFRTTKI